MKVSLTAGAAAEAEVDALAVPVVAGQSLTDPALVELDRRLDGLLAELVTTGEHRGGIHEVLPVVTRGGIKPRRLLLYGLGETADLDGQRLRFAHHELVRAARSYGYRRLGAIRADPLQAKDMVPVVEGCVMGNWEPATRQTSAGSQRSSVDELTLVGFGTGSGDEVDAAIRAGEATNRARELQNLPPNELTPAAVAEEASRIAGRLNLDLDVLEPGELEKQGYRLMLGVAAGSSAPPRMVALRHRGAEDGRTLGLIGKGITFDTGGISLKTSKDMHLMKGDMAGAAAVLSAMEAIAAAGLPVDVLAVVAATENMPGSGAQRPGDVVTSAIGKTVEITDTDAEGRLVLADAITYAIRHGATHLVDLATLTGAASIAIGHAASAAVSNDESLWALLQEASQRAGDRVWRLPIYPDYRVLLKSGIADIKNAGYGEAGVITGGMFIQEFVQDRPWVHLDIAASAWNTNHQLTTIPRGPTGAGTRLLVRLAELIANRQR